MKTMARETSAAMKVATIAKKATHLATHLATTFRQCRALFAKKWRQMWRLWRNISYHSSLSLLFSLHYLYKKQT